MKKVRIQFPPPARPRALARERVADIAVACLRFRNGVGHKPPEPLLQLLAGYGAALHETAAPDTVFICFSSVTRKDWERAARVFYEHAVNRLQDLLCGAGYASGQERLYPDETRSGAHAFPDGPVCSEAYRRSFGDSFSKFPDS